MSTGGHSKPRSGPFLDKKAHSHNFELTLLIPLSTLQKYVRTHHIRFHVNGMQNCLDKVNALGKRYAMGIRDVHLQRGHCLMALAVETLGPLPQKYRYCMSNYVFFPINLFSTFVFSLLITVYTLMHTCFSKLLYASFFHKDGRGNKTHQNNLYSQTCGLRGNRASTFGLKK